MEIHTIDVNQPSIGDAYCAVALVAHEQRVSKSQLRWIAGIAFDAIHRDQTRGIRGVTHINSGAGRTDQRSIATGNTHITAVGNREGASAVIAHHQRAVLHIQGGLIIGVVATRDIRDRNQAGRVRVIADVDTDAILVVASKGGQAAIGNGQSAVAVEAHRTGIRKRHVRSDISH